MSLFGIAGPDASGRGFALRLRAYRQRAQLTQEELAGRTRLSVRALRDLETGRTNRPHRETLRQLAASLELSEAELREFEEARDSPRGASSHTDPQYATAEPDAPAPPSGLPAATPNQLPPNIADFTGRDVTIARLRQLLSEVGTERAPAVVAIDGKAGVGKTTLAVNIAHLVQDQFPDGELFVNLHATGGRLLDASDALARFLRALGVDAARVPEDIEERASLFRSLVADRRLLVVLDDAGSEEQVRPLLPGSGTCGVLVCSREQLIGLEGASIVALDVLEPAEAVELLTRIVGQERVRDEPKAAREIVVRSGYLPLAVRIAGARIIARPHWRLSRLATRLRDERRRLDEMVVGDLDIRARFGRSYQNLAERERMAFRRLALLDAPAIADWVIAALLDITLAQAIRMADRLVSAHLLDIRVIANPPGQIRYHLHDLLRVFGRERAAEEEPPEEQRAALVRAFGGWVTLAEEADRRLPAVLRGIGLADLAEVRRWKPRRAQEWRVDDPLVWFEAERPMLIAAVQQAATRGMVELACALVAVASRFLEARGYDDDLHTILDEALAAARSAADGARERAMRRLIRELRPDDGGGARLRPV